MVRRSYWINKIEDEWRRRSIIWLSGVRRVGKTFLSRSFERIEYFDCELPRVRRQMEDPESFLKDLRGKRVILDEIHRLRNPSELLKIAADYFPETRLLATGSSALQASAKFKDTLTGRKTEVWLTPMISPDLEDFGKTEIPHRLLHGGLPPFFLSRKLPEQDFQEWMDSFWAKDIQELFRVDKRASFQRFLELLFINSGGIFEATKYASPCEISRPTVSSYLKVLEATWVVQVVKPFSRRRQTEIVSAPKVYAFDTAFVCYYRGWHDLRPDDMGYLWEHFVLNEIQGRGQARNIRYWRDKRGQEVDFILVRSGQEPVAVECKWSADAVEMKGLKAFRRMYPGGVNWIVAQDVERSFRREMGGLSLEFLSFKDFVSRLEPA